MDGRLRSRLSRARARGGAAVAAGAGLLVGIGVGSGSAKAAGGTLTVDSLQGSIAGPDEETVTNLDGASDTFSTAGGFAFTASPTVRNGRLTVAGTGGQQTYNDSLQASPTGTGSKLSVTFGATTTGGQASNGSMKIYTSGKTYSVTTPTVKTNFTTTFTNTTSFTSPVVTGYARHTTTAVNPTKLTANVTGGGGGAGTYTYQATTQVTGGSTASAQYTFTGQTVTKIYAKGKFNNNYGLGTANISVEGVNRTSAQSHAGQVTLLTTVTGLSTTVASVRWAESQTTAAIISTRTAKFYY